MALPTPPSYTNPIPNNPFYSPETYILQGAYSPYVVGSGLSVSATGVITASGGGGGGVSNIFGGAGIQVNQNTGNVTVSNSGVLSLAAGSGILLSSATGAITISATGGGGTVTSVTAGPGLDGGTITSAGTIFLPSFTSAGSYTNATITVDTHGRVTAASSGTGAVTSVSGTLPISVTTGATPVVSVAPATLTSSGVVTLSDSVNSTSSSTAATSAAVNTAFVAATAAIPKSCLTNAGDLITATAASTPVSLPIGTNSQVLTVDTACSGKMKWATPAAPPQATPVAFGTLKGCVAVTGFTGNVTALGCNALTGGTGTTFGTTALGYFSLNSLTSGNYNTAVGASTAQNMGTGTGNTLLGAGVGVTLSGGNCNVFLGVSSGGSVSTGSRNVVIGPEVAVAEGSCQLAIGFSATCNWLTGTPSKAIRPGAGIIDSLGSCGTAGQVLASTGANAICWVNSSVPTSATPTSEGIVYGCTTTGGTTSLGANALQSLTTGTKNVAVGCCALTSTTIGSSNTAVGSSALACSTDGDFNVAVGVGSLLCNVSGYSNVAIGPIAMAYNTTGRENVAIGVQALQYNTGNHNTGVGPFAMFTTNTGSGNTAIGSGAGFNISGNCNVVIGLDVDPPNAAGDCQMAIGLGAADYWITGCPNFNIRPGAGIVDCTGSSGSSGEVLMSDGANAICWGTVGGGGSPATPLIEGIVYACTSAATYNTSLGPQAGRWGGGYNTAIGSFAGVNTAATGCYNTTVGVYGLQSLTSGLCNVTLGYGSGGLITTGCNNVLIGPYAATSGPTSCCELAIGFASGSYWLTGCSNKNIRPGAGIIDCSGSVGTNGQYLSAVGGNAVEWRTIPSATPTTEGIVYGCTMSGKFADTVLGNLALNTAAGLGQNNVAVGYKAGCATGNSGNTVVGTEALSSASGGYNTAIGYQSLLYATGTGNTALGSQSASDVLTGNNNLILGNLAGGITSGCCNVVIGNQVNIPVGTGNGQLAIGYGNGQYWLTGCSNKNIRPGAGIVDCAGSAGTSVQVLASNGSNAICWRTIEDATPTATGLVYACTTVAGNAALGECALKSDTAFDNNVAVGACAACAFTGNNSVALGSEAMLSNASGVSNIAIGRRALCGTTAISDTIAIGVNTLSNSGLNSGGNLAIGNNSMSLVTSGNNNVGVGCENGYQLTTGGFNILLGNRAGEGVTSGSCNVIIGNLATVPNLTGDCQLAIGFSNTDYWLTGDCNKAIRPGGGLIDCNGSCGTSGQILSTTGSRLRWTNAPAPATVATAGLIKGCVAVTGLTGNVTLIGCNTAPGSALNTQGTTAMGYFTLNSLTTGNYNTAFGANVAQNFDGGDGNTILGASAGVGLSGACCNLILGYCAGSSITNGVRNVAIGPQATTPVGDCQLAIGFDATNNWLTGTCTKAIKPGAGIIDCNSSCGTGNMVLTSQGNAVQWKNINSALALPNYGNFISTADQTLAVANTCAAVTLNTTVASCNFSVVSGSRVTVASGAAGMYNVQFSAQMLSTSGGGVVEFWLAKNGLFVANSNTQFTIKNASEAEVAALNFLVSLASNDYIQLFWGTDNTNIKLTGTLPSIFGVAAPAIPSMILTIVPVGA